MTAMSPTRIAYVLNIFPKVSETFIAGEMAELRRRGVELCILSLQPPRDELQHEIIRRVGLDRIVEYEGAKFETVLREFRPDLIHAHFAREATAKARELSELTGIPFTFTAHGYDIHRKPPPDFQQRAAAARAVVTVSAANKHYIQKVFSVPGEHVHVIPCGVDTARFCPDENRQPSTSATAPWIVCVARHVAVKNLGLLLDACALLQGRGVKFRCAMVGDGPLRLELDAKRASLGLQEIVEMPGAAEQGEVLRWWQRASVGVLTSDNEGMPVSLMEAAACGVPIVATRVGGIPELIADGMTGVLSPPGDVSAFASALALLLGDTVLRERMSSAARQRAVEKFSVAQQVETLLALWENVLSASRRQDANGSADDTSSTRLWSCAMKDSALPALAAALDFETARHELKRRLPRLSGNGKLKLKALRLTRHKPGRRAVVEYDVRVDCPDAPLKGVTLLGKLRARRSGNEGFRQLDSFWRAGFDAESADKISVPEPIGVISAFQMWFQRKVAGQTAEKAFSEISGTERVALARRVAEAIHKVHRSGVPTDKQHTMADEMRILRECFDKVAKFCPDWAGRLAALMVACEKLGASVPLPRPCGIHRDFYPAQVLVDGSRLWLIDFDLYCLGDPGLDAGNFIGHVTEQALRERGDGDALADVERALEERFVDLAGEPVLASVRAYTALTLARHIFLSTRFPERAPLTRRLLELCEERIPGVISATST
jgi:glycosyltransferase involved in cell wall biosynthesis